MNQIMLYYEHLFGIIALMIPETEAVAVDDIVAFFFEKKWPSGYTCPRCEWNEYYIIRTRRLPLYQCKFCRHQTTVTCGTLMEKSRIPLDKWADALELLSYTNGVNAVQLSKLIGISHTTAWRMLTRIRSAIHAVESARLLGGTVQAGTASSTRWRYRLPPNGYQRHPQEHVVVVGASFDSETEQPTHLKIIIAPEQDLDYKSLTREGNIRYIKRHTHPLAHVTMLKRLQMPGFHPLMQLYDQAERWLNRLFRGLSSKYIQTYLDEYCFRWNAAAEGKSIRDDVYQLCLEPPSLLNKRNSALRSRETYTTPVAV